VKAYVQKVSHSQESSFVYRVKSDPRFARGWHYHPEFELTWIQASQGRRFVGDSIENYRRGDLVLLGPNLPHTWTSEPRTSQRAPELHRAIVIQFGKSFLGDRFFESPEFEGVAKLLDRAGRGLRILGPTHHRVSEKMLRMRKQDRFERLMQLLGILETLAEGRRDVRPICRTSVGEAPLHGTRCRIDRIFAWLNEHYTGPINQGELARQVGLSPAGFSRFFRRATGTTFVQSVGELRISHACNLLIDTEHSILEVSLRSGFNNLSNFNRRFLLLKGMTPREYRRRHRGIPDRRS